MKIRVLLTLLTLLYIQIVVSKNYYIHPSLGNDLNSGQEKNKAFETLRAISNIKLNAGDTIFLAYGQLYYGALKLIKQHGTKRKPIVVTSINWDNEQIKEVAIVDFKSLEIGILIEDCKYINISNIKLTANGYYEKDSKQKMRAAVVIKNESGFINLKKINIENVYFEKKGFIRGKEEVRTANGTQKYGWGIRLINEKKQKYLQNIKIENCHINSVCHTGIKLTGNNKNIKKIRIINNKVENTGGPGIQMSEVKDVYVSNNIVSHSGSNDDSRKWGRGSGLWTWGSSNVLIEKNEFIYANGPGDSAGAHIDYNCDNIVLQYNLSAYNAGGFCEILGNNYNCMYRYNISINDGHRVKGVNGAFQEGKVFWLSGYQGNKEPKGPVNSYFYNNTIYSDESIEAKFAIDNTSKGIVVANNIFCIKGKSKVVLGDQNKRDAQKGFKVENVFIKNNLFLNQETWPKELKMDDESPVFGNPNLLNAGSLKLTDYIPQNILLIHNKGIKIPNLPKCNNKLLFHLDLEKDILDNKIKGVTCIGAICP